MIGTGWFIKRYGLGKQTRQSFTLCWLWFWLTVAAKDCRASYKASLRSTGSLLKMSYSLDFSPFFSWVACLFSLGTPHKWLLLFFFFALMLKAKLGDKNKFYYDEKLKRWVEEGAELPAEEAALPPPPPTMAAFQNGTTDYNSNSTLQTEGTLMNQSPDYKNPTPSEHSSGIPSIPSGSNHFSARGRMGVRSR